MPNITPYILKRETHRHLIADGLGIDLWDVKPEHLALVEFCYEHGLKPETSKMINDIAIGQGIPVMEIISVFDAYWCNPETV